MYGTIDVFYEQFKLFDSQRKPNCMLSFTFGSDPEFILTDEKGNIKSAIEIIKSNKKNKIKIKDNYFFYDNVLAECTIKPASDKDQAVENIRESLKIYKDLIGRHKLTTISAADFDEKELIHKDARESGCDPEFCAYSLTSVSNKKIKKIFKESGWRTAGGHIHLGTELGKSHDTCVMLVRMMDLFLGLPSLILENCKNSKKRRQLYGKPGRYRQPKYGVEYRTVGNFWFSSPELVCLIFDICDSILKMTEEKIYEKFWRVDEEKLNSDSFWNDGGDPSDCHECFGYDLKLLKNMFKKDKKEISEKCGDLLAIVEKHLSYDLNKRIKEYSDCSFDINKEWGI